MPPPPLPPPQLLPPRGSQQSEPEASKKHSLTMIRPRVRDLPERARQRKQLPPQHGYDEISASRYDDHATGSEQLHSLPDLHAMNLNDRVQPRVSYNAFYERPREQAVEPTQLPYSQAHAVQTQRRGQAAASSYSPHGSAQYYPAPSERITYRGSAAGEQRLDIAHQDSPYAAPSEYSEPLAQAASQAHPPLHLAARSQRSDSRKPPMQPAIQQNLAQRRHIAAQPGASVLSPFFKSGNAHEPESASKPPSVSRREPRPAHYDQATNREMSASQGLMLPPRGIDERREDTWSDAHYDATPADGIIHRNGVAPYRDAPAASRRGMEYRPSSLWPARAAPRAPAPPSSRMQAHPSQNPRGGRVTLPPASMSQRSWDPQVSQIRGVRGAGPPSSHYHARSSGVPPYSSRGPLYSDRAFSQR